MPAIPIAAVAELIAAANRAGGKDNVTVAGGGGRGVHCAAGRIRNKPPRRASAASRPLWFLYGLRGRAGRRLAVARFWVPPPVVIRPRALAVGPGARSTPSRGHGAARAGDTVEVLVGDYREQVHLKAGITLRSRVPREARMMAAPSAAVRPCAQNVDCARVTGFLIVGDAQAPLSAGVLIDNSAVELDDVEIEGAGVGIEIRGAAAPLLRGQRHPRLHGCRHAGRRRVDALDFAQHFPAQ